ncbi:hypothetical protein [Micromonospora sp. NPDC048830]|uniref:hypothetical protein n=1 Tax=Micromonospora sp. NPDC048830 TaxID=3364257 RepID=UPI003711062C
MAAARARAGARTETWARVRHLLRLWPWPRRGASAQGVLLGFAEVGAGGEVVCDLAGDLHADRLRQRVRPARAVRAG